MDMQENNNPPRPLVEGSSVDQHFLLNFIMGTYLGPNVRADAPKRSALHRLVEGLPPYSLSDLDLTYVSLPTLENLYYYLVRNAHPSVVLKLRLLHMYFKGNLSWPSLGLSEDSWQFTSFFPLKLHEQIECQGKRIFKGIMFIADPDKSFMKKGDIERFRRLTGNKYDFSIDMDKVFEYDHGYQKDRDEREQNSIRISVETETRDVYKGNTSSYVKHLSGGKRRRLNDPMQMDVQPPITSTCVSKEHQIEEPILAKTCNLEGPSMMTLVATPKVEECTSTASMTLTGTASVGRAGPPVGLVDIGISKIAYLFRVALPGINRNHGYVNCEIEGDGKVRILGMTVTGESSVGKDSLVFRMTTHHLCPPGPFTVSFRLPGPVDPRLMKGKLRTDAILEVVVMKKEMAAVGIGRQAKRQCSADRADRSRC